jgi:hypothetical protein
MSVGQIVFDQRTWSHLSLFNGNISPSFGFRLKSVFVLTNLILIKFLQTRVKTILFVCHYTQNNDIQPNGTQHNRRYMNV